MKRMNEEKLSRMAGFINRYIEEHNGESPSFGEITAYMEMSNSVGYRYLTCLRDRGVIEYNGKSTLTVKGKQAMKAMFRRVQLLGAIPCGRPEDDREEPEGYLALPAEWIAGDCFLLRAKHRSMVDAGIEPGDLLLIQRRSDAADGAIVAALTENGPTLKRFRMGSGRPYLQAENHAYPAAEQTLYPNHLQIQGVCLKVIKDVLPRNNRPGEER